MRLRKVFFRVKLFHFNLKRPGNFQHFPEPFSKTPENKPERVEFSCMAFTVYVGGESYRAKDQLLVLSCIAFWSIEAILLMDTSSSGI